MSELSNKIKALRADLSQAEFAQKSKLSLRTICKIEADENVRLSTLRQIAKSFKLSEADWLDLVVTWIRLEVQDDFPKLSIERKTSEAAALRETDHLPAKIMMRLTDLPKKQQEQIYLLLNRPEILRFVTDLNQMYDSLNKGK